MPRGRRSTPNEYRVEGNVVYLTLTQHREAIIDLEDMNRLSDSRWYGTTAGYVWTQKKTSGQITRTYMHRKITDAKKGDIVDHINGNTFDNRRSNLRICTQSENNINQKSKPLRNIWVDKRRNRFVVEIWKNKKKHYIGSYANINEALDARDSRILEFHGAWRTR